MLTGVSVLVLPYSVNPLGLIPGYYNDIWYVGCDIVIWTRPGETCPEWLAWFRLPHSIAT
jgi:hypothetical protein